jgi:hypothetical protein
MDVHKIILRTNILEYRRVKNNGNKRRESISIGHEMGKDQVGENVKI